MNNLRKAAQAALEALEETTALCVNYEAVEEKDGYEFTEARTVIPMGNAAIAELRAALAEPQPEPVFHECAANGSGPCRIGPHGPKGALQCEWCGSAPQAQQPQKERPAQSDSTSC